MNILHVIHIVFFSVYHIVADRFEKYHIISQNNSACFLRTYRNRKQEETGQPPSTSRIYHYTAVLSLRSNRWYHNSISLALGLCGAQERPRRSPLRGQSPRRPGRLHLRPPRRTPKQARLTNVCWRFAAVRPRTRR